jgi:hypothetical protein
MREYDFEIYKEKIVQIVSEEKIKTIMLSIDNEEFIEPYLNLFKELRLTSILLINMETKGSLNEIQKAIIKVLLLAKCDYFIGNRMSTYSELVYWFSGCKTIVRTVY